MSSPRAYEELLNALDQLPSIGPNAAERIGNFLIRSQSITSLQEALTQAASLKLCERCQAFANAKFCDHCQQQQSLQETALHLLVVESYRQYQQALKQGFMGTIFVLHGLLSPIAGVGPKELNLNKLKDLAVQQQFLSITLALANSAEGRTTQQFIQALLNDSSCQPQCLSFEEWLTVFI